MIYFSDYPKVRGPVCFNCQQVSHPTLCDKIQLCDELQVYNFFSESSDVKAKSHNSKTLHFRDKKAKKA